MLIVPPEFTIASSLASLVIGGLGVFALLKRGDLASPRILYSICPVEDGGPDYKWIRRKELSTLIYIVPPNLDGNLVLPFDHCIYNPGKTSMKDLGIVLKYPSKYGITKEFIEQTTDKGGFDELSKRRISQISLTTTQVYISHPTLVGRHAVGLEDCIIIPPTKMISITSDNEYLRSRLDKIPGFRDYIDMGVSVFSEKTPARNFSVDIIIVTANEGEVIKEESYDTLRNAVVSRTFYTSNIDFADVVSKVSHAMGGQMFPEKGIYFKSSPLSNDPFKQAMAFVIAPRFVEVESKGVRIFRGDTDVINFGSFVYWTTRVDHRNIPNGLSSTELASYLGLRPFNTKHFFRFWKTKQ